MNPLITLAQAKGWLNIAANQTNDDVTLTGVIAGCSDTFGLLTGRDELAPTTYTERISGSGTSELIPSNLPIVSITTLTIDGRLMPASTGFGVPGYFFDSDRIQLTGGGVSFPWSPGGIPNTFPRGRGNVSITYVAGYPNNTVTGEAVTVPSATPYQATLAQAQIYVGGLTLAYAAGGNLTPVTSNPAQGQYVISVTGVLTFNAADAGAALVASYNTLGIPWAVQQCVWEMVGYAYKNKDRIGITNQAFPQAGLNNAYARTPFSANALSTINLYRRTLKSWR